MFHLMKIYTVHVKPGSSLVEQRPVFIKEGFNLGAFLFNVFWAFYHRMWLFALVIFGANVVVALLMNAGYISKEGAGVFQLAIQVLAGFHANDWRRAKLSRQGYVLADVSAGDSLLRAEQRYLERSLAMAG